MLTRSQAQQPTTPQALKLTAHKPTHKLTQNPTGPHANTTLHKPTSLHTSLTSYRTKNGYGSEISAGGTLNTVLHPGDKNGNVFVVFVFVVVVVVVCVCVLGEVCGHEGSTPHKTRGDAGL